MGFPKGWWSFDLGAYRPCDGTYALYPYESLPPLDESLFRGEFQWLGKGSGGAALPLESAAKDLGLTLPAAFVRFVRDLDLQNAVPSCTACEWDPSDAPTRCRVVDGAFTIRFLRDQQDCLFWYLHLHPDGSQRVLVSPIPFDDPALEVDRDVVLANTWECAPDFERFVYRFWLENVLWDRTSTPIDKLDPAQRAYLEHYRPT